MLLINHSLVPLMYSLVPPKHSLVLLTLPDNLATTPAMSHRL